MRIGDIHSVKPSLCNLVKMEKDRYKKVSDKWWFDTLKNKWIHDDKIEFHLFKEIDKQKGTKLGKEFKNTKDKKYY